MGKPLNDCRVGQVVISKRGKDVGRVYVIVGVSVEGKGGRLALADAKGFNVHRPKLKNPKHLQWTSRVVAEVAASVEAGKDIDHGDFCRFLAPLRHHEGVSGVKVSDESLR
jgi:ribosomal protein L14E/L6E/L27E